MKKIAGFVGKFYPPHIGHLKVVDDACEKFDKVYMIISNNDIRNEQIKNLSGFDIIKPELIKMWLCDYYKDNKKVLIEIFDETDLKPYPEDQDVWADKFKQQFPDINVKIADESYRKFNEKFFPEYEFFSIDRDNISVHSTLIRKCCVEGNVDYIKKFVLEKTYTYLKDKYKNNDITN